MEYLDYLTSRIKGSATTHQPLLETIRNETSEDFPSLLETATQTVALDVFDAELGVDAPYLTRRTVEDLREIEVAGLSGLGALTEQKEGTEIVRLHGTELSIKVEPKTYSGELRLSRHGVHNNAIEELSLISALMTSAARMPGAIVASMLEDTSLQSYDGANFFSTTHQNILSSAPHESAVSAMFTKMMLQQIDTQPNLQRLRWILTPASLFQPASREVNEIWPESNPLKPVVNFEYRLTDAQQAWYGIAQDGIVLLTLDDRPSPQVKVEEDFKSSDYRFKVVWDFAIAIFEHAKIARGGK